MKQLTPKPIPKWVQPVTDLHAKNPPMKPIPGWLIVNPEDGPIYFSFDSSREMANLYADRSRGEYVVAVEIRERPKPRRAAKLSLSEIHQRAHDAVFGDGLPEVPPKPRRAAGKGLK